MGYPNAVQTFVTKNPGDVIPSADWNTITGEITAVESGILNGTAPLKTSNSTVANLSVLGNSTIAGSLAITAGPLTIGGTQVLTPTGCRLANTTDQGTSSGAWTGLNWDTETYDPTNMHSTASNSSRITFSGSTGLYAVGACAQWNSVASGQFAIRILLNDATGQCGNNFTGGVTPFTAGSVSGTVRATSTTDYVTVQVYENGGATNSVMGTGTAASTLYGTWFWAAKVG